MEANNNIHQGFNQLNRVFNMRLHKVIGLIDSDELKPSEKIELITLVSLLLQAFKFEDNYVAQLIDL